MKQTTRLRRLGPWLSVKRIKKLKKTHLGPKRRASGVVWALFPLRGPALARSLLSPTVSNRKLAFPSGSERFCSETLISARNAASVKSEPIFEIARNFSEHIPINSEQLVGITRI